MKRFLRIFHLLFSLASVQSLNSLDLEGKFFDFGGNIEQTIIFKENMLTYRKLEYLPAESKERQTTLESTYTIKQADGIDYIVLNETGDVNHTGNPGDCFI